MADNFPATPASSGARLVATDQVAYSGDSAVDLQLVRLVFGTAGAEGSKSVVELDATHGLFVEALATERHLGQVGGHTATATGSFVRPADTTAYSQGDLVANNVTNTSVIPVPLAGAARVAGGGGVIRKLRLIKSTANLTNAIFRVHLFNALPTTTNGDNAAWGGSGALNYIDAFDVTMDQVFTDGAVGFGFPRHGPDVSFKLPSGTTVYALIEFRGTANYTPGNAETFTLVAEIQQD